MLEPILVLTFLNCFFMFGTTVTTCALWWQHKKRPKKTCTKRSSSKNSYTSTTKKYPAYSEENFHHAVNCRKFRDHQSKTAIPKQHASPTYKEGLRCRRNVYPKMGTCVPDMEPPEIKLHKTETTGMMVQSAMREVSDAEHQDMTYSEKLSSEDILKLPLSNKDAHKPTVVTEVCTTQKIIHVLDNDRSGASDNVGCKLSCVNATQNASVSSKSHEK